MQACLTDILRSETARDAELQLERFAANSIGREHPEAVAAWECAWPQLTAHFGLPSGVRRFFEGFDPLDSLKAKLARRTARLARVFGSEEDALRQTEAALVNISTGWKVAARPWIAPRRHFEALDHALRTSQRPAEAALWRGRHA